MNSESIELRIKNTTADAGVQSDALRNAPNPQRRSGRNEHGKIADEEVAI